MNRRISGKRQEQTAGADGRSEKLNGFTCRLPLPTAPDLPSAPDSGGHPVLSTAHLLIMMPMLQKFSGFICLVAMSLTSCAARTVTPPGEGTVRSNPAESNVGKLSYLDLNSPSITQSITPEDAAQGRRFVRVEVVEVVNPNKYPLTFQVHYQSKTNEKVYLGSFG